MLLLVGLLAAVPFSDVAKKFPSATLPLDLKDPAALTVKLSAQDVKALGLQGDALLADWAKKPVKGEKKVLWAVARIERAGHQLLLLRLDDERAQDTRQRTFLFSIGAKGEFLGSYPLHEHSTVGGVVTTNVSTITTSGALARVSKVTRPMTEPGLPAECVVPFEQRGKLTSTGALELMPPFWSARSGTYVDAKTTEELRVFGKQVFYRPRPDAPFVELLGDGNTLHLKDSTTTWVLTWNERRSDISVQNPAGEVQLFSRAW